MKLQDEVLVSMPKIENVTIETATRYPSRTRDESGGYDVSNIDILRLTIPLPGGSAQYEIELAKGVKDSIELAVKLVGANVPSR